MLTPIKLEDGEAEIDAAVIGKGLGIDASAVPGLLRDGKITSRHERGEGVDAGRSRLTFFLGNRRFHVIIDDIGQIIQRSAIDFGDLALPATLRRPGG